jgi:hypothetical protein
MGFGRDLVKGPAPLDSKKTVLKFFENLRIEKE